MARAFDYVLALGKTPIVVNDSRGFFTSRVFGTFVMEGAAMLAEGIPAPLIEHAALAAGMPVGPLAVIDETSLALSVHVMDQTRADLAAEGRTFEPSRRAAGRAHGQGAERPGRAGGGGFYDYPQGEPKRLWPELKRAVRARTASTADVDELKAAAALPAVDRDRALPRRRRADERARRQHRLDLRHRLSGLDRRGAAVHRVGRRARASSRNAAALAARHGAALRGHAELRVRRAAVDGTALCRNRRGA